MLNYVDIYDREYDEPFKANGEQKTSRLLGSFRKINTLVYDTYTEIFLGANSENDVFLITGIEVFGVNGGMRYDVLALPDVKIKESS